MKGSAVSKRLAYFLAPLVALAFLVSCVAGTQSRSQDVASDDQLAADASALDSNIALAESDETSTQDTQGVMAINGPSRILSSSENNDLGLELIEGTGANQLVLNSSAKSGDFSVDRLSAPDRLVIDIRGQQAKSNKNFDTSDTEFINRIRVGSHPDKTRIVLDLAEGQNIEHAIESQDGKMVISLSAAADGSPQIADSSIATQDMTIEQVDSPVAPELAQPEAILVKDEPIAASKQATSSVESLAIEQLSENTNMLVANVESPGQFALEQTAPSEYLLRISNATLNSNVSTVVAAPKSGLIRSVRPMPQGDDVVLRIFSLPGTQLSARASSDKIVISAASESDLLAADLRAQAAPEKVDTEVKPEDVAAKPGTAAEVTLGAENENNDSFDRELEQLALQQYTGRLISLDLQDTDIDNALRIIAEVSNLNIIASDDVTGKVTLRLIDVPWDQALDVILKTNGLDSVREGNVIRIAPVEKLRQEREAIKQLKISQEELEPLQVKYIRISYAKASELKPLVETVVSERGVVTYDERSNQIIVKDIVAGIRNVSELVSRIDLRTPQVLLETQIVEASRRMERDLGAELGFAYVQSPETGNATGSNFPNTINIGGSSTQGGPNTASFFPGPDSTAVSFLLGSADGTKDLSLRLTALESEGRVRIISRPSVATTNNKEAIIKSVEKIRIKTPQGGLSVATGQGASASGASAVATEAIEIGITLEVTPQASPDYYVLLDINAKSSTFGSQIVDGIPSEVERSATSTVLVSSGQTFAMGGIYKITDNDFIEGVPFFKDLPFLGHLFRHSQVRNADEELLFFITPRIVEGSFDDATMKVSS